MVQFQRNVIWHEEKMSHMMMWLRCSSTNDFTALKCLARDSLSHTSCAYVFLVIKINHDNSYIIPDSLVRMTKSKHNDDQMD